MYKIAIVEDDDAMAKQLEEYVRRYGTERGQQFSARRFGDGLSYTTFDQTLDSVTWNDDNTITVRATVTNTGSAAGKDVVQVYAQAPYTEYDIAHGVEKSAIQVLDFAKTQLLEPGQSETVEITADKYLLASWDSTARGGVGGYILDDGDYYIAIGSDAHDALNNVLAAKGASGMTDEAGNPRRRQGGQCFFVCDGRI